MKDSVSNVRFSCQATRCECEIVIEARVIRRSDGTPLYEYDGVELPEVRLPAVRTPSREGEKKE